MKNAPLELAKHIEGLIVDARQSKDFDFADTLRGMLEALEYHDLNQCPDCRRMKEVGQGCSSCESIEAADKEHAAAIVGWLRSEGNGI